ncbi:MAG: hypothetical protein ACOC7T_02835 [Planctomycetota bacterium]
MVLWAGIDEAGYGPRLGPLVVAASAFRLPQPPDEGLLWHLLRDAVCRTAGESDGRLVVNDSKQVYSPSRGLRRLEEGVLGFLATARYSTRQTGTLLEQLQAYRQAAEPPQPWFAGARRQPLPLQSNSSALASRSDVLRRAMDRHRVRFLGARAVVVFTPEFNRIVERTRNKAALLFQKCGLLLRELWARAGRERCLVVVDRHGGRKHYRKLLRDAFPRCRCDVRREEEKCSAYRVRGREADLFVSFRQDGDALAMPTALGSMIAKYLRELHMAAFNRYWQERLEGLKPTAGYGADARRFLRDIEPALREGGVDRSTIVRIS